MINVQLHVTNKLKIFPKVIPVQNKSSFTLVNDIRIPLNKPRYGLWTSTFVNNTSRWIDYYKNNWQNHCDDLRFKNKTNYFLLYPNDAVNIFTIDSYNDLILLCKLYHLPKKNKVIDFELLSKDYDALHLTHNGLNETNFVDKPNLISWACESILWFKYCFNKTEQIEL